MDRIRETLEAECRLITRIVDIAIGECPHPVFLHVPEDRSMAAEDFKGRFMDYMHRPASPVVCLEELSRKDRGYLTGFFKSLREHCTRWGVVCLQENLQNLVIRQTQDRLSRNPGSHLCNDDSVRVYFKDDKSMVRVYPWKFSKEGFGVQHNPDYGAAEISVDGVVYPVSRLLLNIDPHSFRRCGLGPDNIYFNISLKDLDPVEFGPDKVQIVFRHHFRFTTDNPELSNTTVYTP